MQSGSNQILRNGFTLIDLTITVLIVGILAASASPRFANMLNHYRVESAAQRIRADLELARESAISRSTTVTIQFDPASETYTIPAIKHLDSSGRTYSVDLLDAPYNAQLLSATLGSDTTLQFNLHGIPDSGGTIKVQAGNLQQTVTLDAHTGRASIP